MASKKKAAPKKKAVPKKKSTVKKKPAVKKKAAPKKTATPKKKPIKANKAAKKAAPKKKAGGTGGTCDVYCQDCGCNVASGLNQAAAVIARATHKNQSGHQNVYINCSQ